MSALQFLNSNTSECLASLREVKILLTLYRQGREQKHDENDHNDLEEATHDQVTRVMPLEDLSKTGLGALVLHGESSGRRLV